MSRNILYDSWYTAFQASQELQRSLKEMQKLYKDVAAGKHGNIPMARYADPNDPAIQGRVLLQLVGELPAPTARHRANRF